MVGRRVLGREPAGLVGVVWKVAGVSWGRPGGGAEVLALVLAEGALDGCSLGGRCWWWVRGGSGGGRGGEGNGEGDVQVEVTRARSSK